MLEGEGAIHAAASRSDRPIAVQLSDETGRPLEGVAVSFRLPEEGPSGTFEGGMKTDIAITSADGRAAVHGIRWNRTPGSFQIRITAAKGESRAGAIASQYISDTPIPKPSSAVRKGGKKKWIVMLAIAGGGAAATGLAVGRSGGSAGQVPTPSGQPVQIGPPTISIGKP